MSRNIIRQLKREKKDKQLKARWQTCCVNLKYVKTQQRLAAKVKQIIYKDNDKLKHLKGPLQSKFCFSFCPFR